jgi:addiction module RelE/StbE family toxin
MVFKVDFSEQAADDLDEIIRYISGELCNPQAAERFFNAVDKKRGLLREQPYMFPLYHDEKLSADGYRFSAIGNYVLFYLVDDEKSVVSIARILYGGRDIPSVFYEE